MEINEITSAVLAAAVAVHRKLGPGLLESAYETFFVDELTRRDLNVQRQVAIPIEVDGVRVDCGYRIDILVEGCAVVELKAVAKLEPVHTAQALTYMRLGGYPVGLLINFNAPYLGDGAIKRLVNRYDGPKPRESG
jgi:GxxExxY protein